MNISDLFAPGDFVTAIDEKYVRVQSHPSLPLTIANYAEKAQYENYWTPVTRNCRGLIFDSDGMVLARPYPKFFNYGDEANTGTLDLTAPAVVTDKLDGSLGISYPTPNGPAIASRGSFTSDQANHATELLRDLYPTWQPESGYTYLFEIIYPGNRIVIDYEGLDDLVLHGRVHIDTGRIEQGALDWPGPVVETFPYTTLGEALAAGPRPNVEGYVLLLDGNRQVKIKQDDYVALHRIITGLNARTVWEWLGEGKPVADLCASVPDEFHGWIQNVATDLFNEAHAILGEAVVLHRAALDALPADFERGDYARSIAHLRDAKPYMFLLLDGNDAKARELAWRAVKPPGAFSMVNHSEAVA